MIEMGSPGDHDRGGKPGAPVAAQHCGFEQGGVANQGRNGLGLILRERGHRRVPLPPHRITGVIMVVAFLICLLRK
jgi:hypothetical protein